PADKARIKDLNDRKAGRAGGANAVCAVVAEGGIAHFRVGLAAKGDIEAIVREAEDIAIVDDELCTGKEPDAVDAAVARTGYSIDPQVAEDDIVACSSLHDDAVGARDQHRGNLTAAAVDGHSLGDSDSAKAAGIERVDLAARRRLGDRAGKGLARCRAATRTDVDGDGPHPGPRRL